jgi:hypothetical protein
MAFVPMLAAEGIATGALSAFLSELETRPLHAHVAG